MSFCAVLVINVYVYKTPTTVKEIKQTICELSNVVDERVAGGKIVAGMEKELAFVRARVGNIAPEEHISVMALSYMGHLGLRVLPLPISVIMPR